VDLIVLAALHHSLSKMTDGAGIGYRHLDALLPAQRQRQVQTVETRRFHANAHHAARLPQVTKDDQMAFRRVGEISQRLQVLLPPQAHHQFLRTDFDSTRVQVAHNTLLELSFRSGPPDPVPSPVELEYAGSYGLGFSSAWEKRAGGLSTRQAREFPPGLSADRPPPPDTANSRYCFTPEINGQSKIQAQTSAVEVCGSSPGPESVQPAKDGPTSGTQSATDNQQSAIDNPQWRINNRAPLPRHDGLADSSDREAAPPFVRFEPGRRAPDRLHAAGGRALPPGPSPPAG